VIIGMITFGGRVTDKQDQTTNNCLMEAFYNPRLLDDSYTFCEELTTYRAPPEGSLDDLREYIEQLPVVDPPEIFGLHRNADITCQQKMSNEIVNDIILTEAGGGGGGEESNDDGLVDDYVKMMLERIPKDFDKRDGHADTFMRLEDGTMNSYGVFVEQEMVRFNFLTSVMKKTSAELRRAIKGLVVMSGEMEAMYKAIVLKRCPPVWENAGYPCLKPLASWTEDFYMRLEVTHDWLVNGPPKAYWVSGFFFPQGFMTAVVQLYSRKSKIAVDILIPTAQISGMGKDELEKAADVGSYIYGTFFEGCRFDRDCLLLAESYPAELFDEAPCIALVPEVAKEYDPGAAYACPLYKTSIRAGTLSTTGHSTNFVGSLYIPTNKKPEHWVRRGAAMLCMLDS